MYIYVHIRTIYPSFKLPLIHLSMIHRFIMIPCELPRSFQSQPITC